MIISLVFVATMRQRTGLVLNASELKGTLYYREECGKVGKVGRRVSGPVFSTVFAYQPF